MEILNYTEEHKNFRKRLRAFLEKEVTPYADQWERDGIVPKSVWRKMGQGGFLCTDVAPEYGGMGGDFLYSLIVAEEMTVTRQTGLITPLHSDIVVPYISTFGSEELKQKYLPGCVSGDTITAVAMTEPGAGSDLTALKTTAVLDGSDYVIHGEKLFITNAVPGRTIGLVCMIDDVPSVLIVDLPDATPGEHAHALAIQLAQE